MSLTQRRATTAAIPLFFGLKVAIGIAILKFSALWLATVEFAAFSQFFLLFAFLNMIAAAGLQMGLIRSIAAADGDSGKEAAVIANALTIWLAASVAVCLPLSVFRAETSVLLIGAPDYSAAVPWVAVVAMLSGPGQILAALLTGRGRGSQSLLAQGVGLLFGGTACLVLLWLGRPIEAVIAFGAGALLTAGVAIVLARVDRLRPGPRALRLAVVRDLSHYSVAYVLTAALLPAALFVLRYFYLQQFGVAALNEWLVASRVSDTTTQLTALYMSQVFLPGYVGIAGSPEARRLIARSLAIAGLGMALMLGAFAIGSRWLIPLFLSRQFLPAAPEITLYMVGDVFRVGVSLTLHAALARKRLGAYLGLEAACVLTFSCATMLLVGGGHAHGPFIAYVGTYFVACLACMWAMLVPATRGVTPPPSPQPG